MPCARLSLRALLLVTLVDDLSVDDVIVTVRRAGGELAPQHPRGIDRSRWNAGHVTLIRLAATLPGTDRVLVNAAIKRQLCLSVTGDRSWLRQVRPWYGHAAHLHIHFRCPVNEPECVDQAPPPAGDGCDASLQWWFDRLDQPPLPVSTPPPLRLPAACAAILRGAAAR